MKKFISKAEMLEYIFANTGFVPDIRKKKREIQKEYEYIKKRKEKIPAYSLYNIFVLGRYGRINSKNEK